MATPKGLITVKVRGQKEILASLQRRIKRVESFRVPLDAVAKDFYETERRWFASKGGGRWKPLRPSYAAWKRKSAPGKPIMQLSSRMWREFTGDTRHYRIQKNMLRVWIAPEVDYWKQHEQGYKPRYGRIPKRRILATTLKTHVPRWHRMITAWLSEKMELTPNKLLTFGGR